MSEGVRLRPLEGLPLVVPGDDLASLLRSAADRAGIELGDGVLVVCQKVVSKAEGALVRLADVAPSPKARELAAAWDKDPRHI